MGQRGESLRVDRDLSFRRKGGSMRNWIGRATVMGMAMVVLSVVAQDALVRVYSL